MNKRLGYLLLFTLIDHLLSLVIGYHPISGKFYFIPLFSLCYFTYSLPDYDTNNNLVAALLMGVLMGLINGNLLVYVIIYVLLGFLLQKITPNFNHKIGEVIILLCISVVMFQVMQYIGFSLLGILNVNLWNWFIYRMFLSVIINVGCFCLGLLIQYEWRNKHHKTQTINFYR